METGAAVRQGELPQLSQAPDEHARSQDPCVSLVNAEQHLLQCLQAAFVAFGAFFFLFLSLLHWQRLLWVDL